MSDLAMAMRIVKGFGLNVIQWPSGRFGFFGRVPAQLAYVKADGSEVPDAELREVSQSSFPAMTCKRYGIKTRGFDTEEQARDAAKAAGFEIDN